MARPELGKKRRCLSCETKYYDLGKDPVVCPKCGAVFELNTPEKPVPKEKPVAKTEENKADKATEGSEPETISLEDADADDGETVDGEDIPNDIPDVETDDDDDDAGDTFLEDDEEEDDMSDLVKVTKDDKDDN